MGAAFHWDAVKGFATPFYDKTIELLKLWSAEGSKPVEVTDILPKYTLDVLGTLENGRLMFFNRRLIQSILYLRC